MGTRNDMLGDQFAEGWDQGPARQEELALDGSVRPVNGVLPMAIGCRNARKRRLVVPEAKIEELVDQLLPGMRPKQSTTGTAGAPAAPPSANCTPLAASPSPTPGTPARRACWPGWASRPWPPPALATPSPAG